jgi:preprotein translocase subunit SecF
MAVSIALILGSIALVAIRGLNFGVDFAGGLMMEVRFEQGARLDALRNTVNAVGVGEASLQTFGAADTISIRLPLPPGDDEAVQQVVQKIQSAMRANHPAAEFRRVETVSGKVSGELIRDGALAILFAMIGISLYIWFRFEWQFGVGALFALVQDILLTVGMFSLTQMEFDLTTVAALLLIGGYSINDTVIVYDRIRETLRKYKKLPVQDIINKAVNQTLARTTMTSFTTLLALFALWFFGGEVIRGFVDALIVGILIGTYSSIFVAAPMLIYLNIRKPSREEDEAEAAETP